MGYVDSVPYLYMSTENISDMANASMENHHFSPPHPLKGLYNSPALADQASEQAVIKHWTRTPPLPPEL